MKLTLKMRPNMPMKMKMMRPMKPVQPMKPLTMKGAAQKVKIQRGQVPGLGVPSKGKQMRTGPGFPGTSRGGA